MAKNGRRKKKVKGRKERRKERTMSKNNKGTGLAHNFNLLACVNAILSVRSTSGAFLGKAS